MSIEIDILTGDTSLPQAQPLLDAVWPPTSLSQQPWGHLAFANPDLRVLLEADGELVCHVGVHTRMAMWNNRRMNIGGISSVATHPDHCRRGYASVALNAAIQTLRDREDVQFAVLFCDQHNAAFYEARGWQAFVGDVWCEQPGGRIKLGHMGLESMAPHTFDIKRGAGGGAIDLCGLPW